jgi:hypothetical protein
MAPSQDTDPHALHNRLRLAHQARRAKEHQLDDIRRALCDIGFMNDDDPYSHPDLADVIRQNGQALLDTSGPASTDSGKQERGNAQAALARVRAEVARIRATTRTWEPVADLLDAALDGTGLENAEATGPAESTIPNDPAPADPAPKPYPLTSPEWRSGEGPKRCDFRMNTGDGRLQCTFRAGHPPHGHSLNAKNPGTPCPDVAPEEGAEGIDEVATALFEILSAFSPVSSHNGTRLGWTLPMPVAEVDYNRWMTALTEDGA